MEMLSLLTTIGWSPVGKQRNLPIPRELKP